MHRRLSALAVAALLCSAAACGRAGDLTGPDDASVPAIRGPVYDEGVLDVGSGAADETGGMFGNGNVAGDGAGDDTSILDNGGMGGSGGITGGPANNGDSAGDNGGMGGSGG